MKIFNLKYLILLFASVLLITSCGDDEVDDNTSKIVGNYVINKATISETFFLSTTSEVMPQVPVPIGTDITQGIQAALLGAVTCSSPDKSYIELRADKSIFISCEGADAINGGTWEEVSATELKLNLNSTAIPASPTGFVLTVTDVVTTATSLSGTTSVPLPKEVLAVLVQPYGLTLADAPAVYVVKFTIELLKK